MKLYDWTLARALEALKRKEISALELTQAHIDRMEGCKNLNAFITETPDRALADARESDQRYANGTARALEGIPIAHKDLFCTKGIPTTAAAKVLHNFVPPYESTVSQKLKDAGTSMLGKLNLDQFGMGATTRNTIYGPTKNPYKKGDKDLVSGGSSGGTGSAVAAGMIMAGTSTDTGASTRVPAAYCGAVGLKTSYGRCSRWGCVAYASSFDTPGVIARNVKDTALLFENMAGYDPKDSTSSPKDGESFSNNINSSVKGMKIGIVKEADVEGLTPHIKKVWQETAKKLEAEGAEIVEVSLPHLSYALPAYYLMAMAEASSNLARYDGVRYGHRSKDAKDLLEIYMKSRAEGFLEETKRRILVGTFVLSSGFYDAYFVKAAKVRRLIVNDYNAAFEKVDALLMPTTADVAFEINKDLTPLEDYAIDIFMTSANLAGICAMAIPAGYSENGLPMSIQLQAKPFAEQTLFNVGSVIEAFMPKMKKPSEII